MENALTRLKMLAKHLAVRILGDECLEAFTSFVVIMKQNNQTKL